MSELAPKFPERAKEVLGDDYAGPVNDYNFEQSYSNITIKASSLSM